MPNTFPKSSHEIRRALLREHRAGVDVGELLVDAITAAQKQLAKDDRFITDNRPGSWEAALVEQFIVEEW